jgi:DNA-binding response OmpR family regulator
MASFLFPDVGAAMNTGMRVLVIEDQHDIAANIWDFLEARGYQVDHAADGATGLSFALRGGYEVIVLDLNLPRLDGLELCRRLREAGPPVPVLMLTARDTLEDKLRGFAEGADDYMVKPFAMRELEARIRNLHRRALPAPADVLRFGDLSYDQATMHASRAGIESVLTPAQSRILVTLMQKAPAIATHDELLRAVRRDGSADSRALHTHIYELRSLIDRPHAHAMILSVHGVGYRLQAAS